MKICPAKHETDTLFSSLFLEFAFKEMSVTLSNIKLCIVGQFCWIWGALCVKVASGATCSYWWMHPPVWHQHLLWAFWRLWTCQHHLPRADQSTGLLVHLHTGGPLQSSCPSYLDANTPENNDIIKNVHQSGTSFNKLCWLIHSNKKLK